MLKSGFDSKISFKFCAFKFRAGIHFITFTCEPTFLLPYLYKRIVAAGGRIEQRRVKSFEDLHNFDIVINCAGLGAQVLIENDTELKPIRGQVMRIKAPWITEVVLDDSDDGNYIIPKYEKQKGFCYICTYYIWNAHVKCAIFILVSKMIVEILLFSINIACIRLFWEVHTRRMTTIQMWMLTTENLFMKVVVG